MHLFISKRKSRHQYSNGSGSILKVILLILSVSFFSFEIDHKDQYQLQKVAINILHTLQNTFFLCWGLVLMSRVIHFRQWKIFFDLHHFILWLYYLQCIRLNIRNLVKFWKVYITNRFYRLYGLLKKLGSRNYNSIKI